MILVGPELSRIEQKLFRQLEAEPDSLQLILIFIRRELTQRRSGDHGRPLFGHAKKTRDVRFYILGFANDASCALQQPCMDLISPDTLPPGKILRIIEFLNVVQRVSEWLRSMQQRQRINRRQQDILRDKAVGQADADFTG